MADGQVVIDTKLDTGGVVGSVQEIEESMRRMATSITGITDKSRNALQKQIDSFAKLGTQVTQQQEKVDKLKQALDEYGNTKIPTDEYTDLEKQIDAAYEELDRLVAKQQEYLDLGVPENAMPQSFINELDAAGLKVGELEEKLMQLSESGQGYTLGINTDQYVEMLRNLNIEEEKLADLNNRLGTSYDSINIKMGEMASSSTSALSGITSITKEAVISGMTRLGTAAKNVVSQLVKMGGHAIVSGVKKVASSIASVGTGAEKAGISLKQMVMYGLGIRSLYTLFSKLKSYITEGFQNLAQYSNETNQAISSVKSSLSTLKNALATAFAPIVNTVAPYLTKLINMLVTAANYVSMFFAMLQGKSTYTKAIPVQEDYAGATQDVADATNNAAQATEAAAEAEDDYLSGLDEVHKYTEESSSSGSGGSGGGSGGGGTGSSSGSSPLFEEAAITGLNFDSWGDAFDKFLDYLLDEGIPALKNGLTKLAGWINDFSSNLYEMFTFPGVLEKVQLLGTEIADCFNDFVNLIDWDMLGRAFGAGINLVLNFLTSMIYEFDWQNLGAKLAEMINGAIDEIDFYNLGKFLWSKFKIALETLAGFITNLNMPEIAQKLSDMVHGFFDSMIDTVKSIDWTEIGKQIQRFITNFDWAGMGSDVANSLNSIVEAVRNMDLGTTLGDLINGFFSMAVEFCSTFDWAGLGTTVVEAVNNFFTTTDWKQVGTGISDFVNGLLEAIKTFFRDTNWAQVGKSLIDGILSIDWLSMIANLVEIGYWILEGILEGIVGAIAGIGEWLYEHLVQPIVDNVKQLFGISSPSTVMAEIGTNIIEGLFNGIKSMVDNIIQIFVDLFNSVKEKLESIKQTISEAWNTVKETASQIWESIKTVISDAWENIKTAVSDAIDTVKQTISDVWDSIKQTASDIWDGITSTLSDAWDTIKTTATNAFNNIKEGISNAWNTVKSTTSSVWNSIKSTLSSAWDNLKTTATNKFNSIKTVVSDAFDKAKENAVESFNKLKEKVVDVAEKIKSGVGDAIEGIKTTFKNVFDSLVGIVKTPINSVISAINSLIRGVVSGINGVINTLNHFSFSIPSWVPGYGGKTIGFNIPTISSYPQIPTLASGAVIPPRSEFLAVLGDQPTGNNIEAPEELLRKIVREETANSAKNGSYEFVAQLNRKTIFDETIAEAKMRQMQTGKNPFELA